MKHNLILDWSAFIRNLLYSLLSKSLPITRVTEIEEIRFRAARKLYKLLKDHSFDTIIIAKDNKDENGRTYWRCNYLQEWYKDNVRQGFSKSMNKHLINIDNKWFTLDMDDFGITRSKKGLTKKDTPNDIDESVELLSRSQLKEVIPEYKGNRSEETWVFEMSKDEWSEAMDRMAEDICGLFPKCKIIDAYGAEADDVAGILASIGSEKGIRHTLMTHDGDWYQLIDDNTKIYNLAKESWVESIPDYYLEHKILMGDSGDGISSTWVPGQAVNIGKKKAMDILADGTIDTVDPAALLRNRTLITLDLEHIPKYVKDNILMEARRPWEFPVTAWDDFSLTEKDRELLDAPEGSVLHKHWGDTYSVDKVNVKIAN